MRTPPIQLTPEQIATVNKHQQVIDQAAAVRFKEVKLDGRSTTVRYSVVRLTPTTMKLVVHVEPLSNAEQARISGALYAMCSTDLKNAGIVAEVVQDEDQPNRLVFMPSMRSTALPTS